MNSLTQGTYSALRELMNYYHIEFNVYYVLTIIVFINALKSVINYINLKKDKTFKFRLDYFDLVITIIAGIGLLFGIIFIGILSDISLEHSNLWFGKVFILSIIVFILFIIQLFATFKNRSKTPK